MSPLRGVGVGLLAIVAIFCLLGPISTGREFATVYPDYVRARPSLVPTRAPPKRAPRCCGLQAACASRPMT